MSYRHSLVASASVVALAVAACGSSQHPATTPATTPAPAPEQTGAHAAFRPGAVHPSATLQNNRIDLSETIEFDTDSDRILPQSDAILTEVTGVFTAHPEIHHVRVEGHTDNVGVAAHNQELSVHRASAVVQYLRAHGVTIQLDPQGFGSTQSVCTEDTDDCRHRNRRVDFVIVP